MGFDYALVHVKYTIPPAVVLTLLYRPFFTKVDVYKICFLVTIAVASTIPWDSYLIRTRVWSYPPNAVLGLTFMDIPAEELFFFVIQTYDTALLYLCLSKPILHVSFLDHGIVTTADPWSAKRLRKVIGVLVQLALAATIVFAAVLIRNRGTGTYMGLILAWAVPFLLFLWSLTSTFLLKLPLSSTALPIALPTLYLWIVDTFALRRGTWVITKDTKYGLYLWDGLEIEEALFFLLTNMLVVFGLVAFDNAIAILDAFPHIFVDSPPLPSPTLAMKALLTPSSSYNGMRIVGFSQALDRLQSKSRSFYLASATFGRRLRIDLILLYSFCRVADDMIDNSSSTSQARQRIEQIRTFLDIAYRLVHQKYTDGELQRYVDTTFPPDTRLAFLQLPVARLSKKPLYDLLKGFEMDLEFSAKNLQGKKNWPIATADDLQLYGSYVAGTIAELCIELVFYHSRDTYPANLRNTLKADGGKMGTALQLVNIARDFKVDAEMGRVYIPLDWLKAQDLTPEDVLKHPSCAAIERIRTSLLTKAFSLYNESRGSIEQLPRVARGPMRVAVESYMEIGRVLRNEKFKVKAGKATVPKLQRIIVAWKALSR